MQPDFKIIIQDISYTIPNADRKLFDGLTLTFTNHKIGLVGRNGIGKSTLFKLIAGEIYPEAGTIQLIGSIAYVPQNPNIKPKMTVAAVLGFEEKLTALARISSGSVDEKDFAILNEEWDIAERFQQQLAL